MRRRIWCETCPWSELAQPSVLEELARRQLEPIVAVRPDDLAALPGLERAFAAASVPTAYWPMLADEEGRWVSAGNVDAFCDFARRVAVAARREPAHGSPSTSPLELMVDLEPPIGPTRPLARAVDLRQERRRTRRERLRGRAAALVSLVDAVCHVSPRGLAHARHALEHLVDDLAAQGVLVSACVLPPLVTDRRALWQTLLGTPLSGPRWHQVHVMLYSSILEGWSRGLVRRQDARALVARFAAAAVASLGERAAVALGVVGTGAFGDEPTYRGPGELADDVALVRAAGIDHLSLFDLGGVLRRGDTDTWLDAFTDETALSHRAQPTPRTLRAEALYGVAGVLGGGT